MSKATSGTFRAVALSTSGNSDLDHRVLSETPAQANTQPSLQRETFSTSRLNEQSLALVLGGVSAWTSVVRLGLGHSLRDRSPIGTPRSGGSAVPGAGRAPAVSRGRTQRRSRSDADVHREDHDHHHGGHGDVAGEFAGQSNKA
jgi:hypothetical protein